MKKLISLLIAVMIVFSLAACGASPAEQPAETPVQKTDYILSDEPKEGSVIDGLMTDISGRDPVLQRTTASWLDTCVLYEVNIRQYTEEGTFKAFEGHLDRLKDMGINTLWLMPIHPISETGKKGTLGSYYAVSDYKAVNPEFGTVDDFKHLVDKAHDMGFKVILDWVANHTGWDNAWIKEHDDWYVHTKSGDIESPYDWTDVAKLDYDNYEMRAEMIGCMQYWVEEFGIDGYRCDHAIGVPAPFWNAAVYKLKSINSEIMMLAETSATEGLTTYAFDSCYNDLLYGQAGMVRSGIAVSDIQKGIVLDQRYVNGSFPMNYLDNHDKNSDFDSAAAIFKNAYPALLAITYLSPGMPMLYTSDEEAYDHCIEFFEKDPVVWEDEPIYAPLIKTLSKLKAENPALASTNTDIEIISAEDSGFFAFSRTSGDNKLIYIANLFYEDEADLGYDFDFDSAACVIHYDGENSDFSEVEMKAADFKSRDYAPYEFYILNVNN